MPSMFRRFSYSAYFMFILLNLFMLLFLGNYLYFILLATMVVVPLATFLMVEGLRPQVNVVARGASYVEQRGDEFLFALEVSNRSIFFANNALMDLKITNSLTGDEFTHTINFPINPLQVTKIEYPLKSDHCGIISVDIDHLYLFDLLNFFKIKKHLGLHHEIPVLPNPIVLDNLDDLDFTEGYSNLEESHVKGNDTSEVSEIREYIPGDKLQNIHWKLSAKKDNLMVKDHISLTSSQLILYVELAKTEDHLIDSILDYTYGIGQYLVQHGKPFSLLWYKSSHKECASQLILNSTTLRDCITEILYQQPFTNYQEIRELIPALTGHNNFITIGVDLCLKKELHG